MSISIAFRHYLSISHLSAAALFAKQCQDIESIAGLTPIDSQERRQHNAYAVSSVIVSTALLEAPINELVSDCADAHSTERHAALQTKHLMGRLWDKGIPRPETYPILINTDISKQK